MQNLLLESVGTVCSLIAGRKACVETTEQVGVAFARYWPAIGGGDHTADQLARTVLRALDGWGHGEQILVLSQVTVFGDPTRLRCWFRCENCHVSQQVMMQTPSVQ